MDSLLIYLRSFNFISVVLRLSIALAAGGLIGYGRAKKQRAAGLRTYMLTSVGAALAMLLACYEYEMLHGAWAPIVESVGMKFDASRYGAQVVSGIGFLGAATIMAAKHQQVSGLSTATGLFACVCIGLASGAGFYECVIIVVPMLIYVLERMYPLETEFKRRVRNINLYVEFDSIEDIEPITDTIREMKAQLFELEIEQAKREKGKYPSAIFSLKLSAENTSHSEMLSSIAELPCVHSIQELIS